MANASCLIPCDIEGHLKKSHGVFMLMAWWLLVAHAILFSRYFKPLWTTEWMGGKLWFQLHRLFNFVGVAFSLMALLFMVIVKQGWIPANDKVGDTHAICGMTAISIGVVQIFFSFFRPKQTSTRRPVFNWLHRLFGISGFTLAAASVFLSLRFGFFSPAEWGQAPLALMVCYVLAFVGVVLALEFHVHWSEGRSTKRGKPGDDQDSTSSDEEDEVMDHVQTTRSRSFILGTFTLVSVTIVATLAFFVILY